MEREQKGEEKLALELLKEVKRNATKWFIISIVELAIILSIVATWFIVSYVVPVDDVTTKEDYSISQDSGSDGTNNNYIKTGDIKDGKADDKSSKKK